MTPSRGVRYAAPREEVTLTITALEKETEPMPTCLIKRRGRGACQRLAMALGDGYSPSSLLLCCLVLNIESS